MELKMVLDIRLDTRRGIGIKNQIEPQPTQQTLAREQISIQQFGSNWEQRAGPRGVYNCAGLVWASRRTAIVDDEEWNKIYDHDNYRELYRFLINTLLIIYSLAEATEVATTGKTH